MRYPEDAKLDIVAKKILKHQQYQCSILLDTIEESINPLKILKIENFFNEGFVENYNESLISLIQFVLRSDFYGKTF